MRRHRLPVRLRLVVGFVSALLVLLTAASAFVFWRVQVALDGRLNQDLHSQTADLRQAARHLPPRAAVVSLRDEGRNAQLLSANGNVVASGFGIPRGERLLSPGQAQRAAHRAVSTGRGYLFSKRGKHLRIFAVPVGEAGHGAVAVSAVRLDQRDEALRELLAQLAIANLIALALASVVGYRFAHLALDPVERYRARAERIAGGETGVRLDVPEGPPDEITRLGATLNSMLEALERASARQQQFIDDASHELRTPLTTLAAEVDVALRKPRTAAEYEAALRRVARDTDAVLELAETLLTLGALGSAAPDATELQVQPLLETAARRARSQLEERSARTVVVQPANGIVMNADATLLRLALGNLVDNAVRHGAGDIAISADAQTDRVAAILVRDEGTISADFLEHAAERFRRHETSRTGAGAGLGLSLVDAIAVAHHGQLRICSAGRHHVRNAGRADIDAAPCAHPDDGTTITLLLPRTPDG